MKFWKVCIWILAIIIVFIGLFFGYRYFFIQQEAYPSANCYFVKNVANPTLEYTYITSNSSFKCEADECIIKGSILIDKPDITIATFNFCPQNNLNYKYCTGSANLVEGIGNKYTEDYKLLMFEEISFFPKYLDGSIVENKKIYIKEYTCPSDEQNIKIIAHDEYALNREITDVTIQLELTYGDISNIKVVLILIDKATVEQVGKKIITTTNAEGKVMIDCKTFENCFNYKPSTPGVLTIRATINPDVQQAVIEKDVEIKPGLRLILNCPIQSEVNEEIECGWLLKDDTTEEFIIGAPQIEVLQAGEPLSYTPIGTTGVSFMTNATGSVDVYITMTRVGYVSDEKYAQVSIQPAIASQVFYIDNRDFFYYTSGIEVGKHTLKIRVEQIDEKVEIQHIAAKMETPAGQVVPLNFIEYADGWRDDYDFQQAGHTYHLTGEITFVDPEKENQPIKYDILTASIAGEEHKTTFTYTIVGISVGVVVIAGGLVFLFTRRKKKKKKK